MKVKNVKNRRGNYVPNQFLIYTDESIAFQSYDSIIAIKYNSGKVVLGPNWDYSRTTGKYRSLFLGETKRETQAKIDSGEYTVNNNL